MKNLSFLVVGMVMIILGCTDAEKDNVRNFVAGTYVKPIGDEFTKGTDTLVISVLDYQSGSYTIIRKMSYRQKIDGQMLPQKRDSHKWIAVYLPETRQLKEQSQGKIFSFIPAEQALIMGSSQYLKISKGH